MKYLKTYENSTKNIYYRAVKIANVEKFNNKLKRLKINPAWFEAPENKTNIKSLDSEILIVIVSMTPATLKKFNKNVHWNDNIETSAHIMVNFNVVNDIETWIETKKYNL